MSGSKSTSVEAQQNTVNGEGAFGGEELTEYTVFLSDSFGRNPSTGRRAGSKFFDSNSVPNQIDGHNNDDSYRTSRHHLINLNPNDPLSVAANEAVDAIAGIGAKGAAAISKAASSSPKYSSGLMSHLRENSLARQLQSKRDQPAIIRLVQHSSRSASAIDGREAGPGGWNEPWVNLIPPNTKFFLETVTENREEKVQIVDTFGEFVAFFFGARPEVYTYTGTLLNSMNHNWKNEFMLNYEHFLRGSQAVKNRASIFLQYDDVIVEGFMLNSQTRQTAVEDKAIPFQFNLLVLNRSPLSPLNMLQFRNATQPLTLLETQLMASLTGLVDSIDSKPEDRGIFLMLRDWMNSSRTPSSGLFTTWPSTNKVEPESTKSPVMEQPNFEFKERFIGLEDPL